MYMYVYIYIHFLLALLYKEKLLVCKYLIWFGFNTIVTMVITGYCIPRTKYVRGILWFSRRYAAASASADTSSFSR